jgi:hypothetical protein
LLALAVAQQVGGRHHPTALLSHQRGALGDPRVDDELARVARSSWLMTVLTDTDTLAPRPAHGR